MKKQKRTNLKSCLEGWQRLLFLVLMTVCTTIVMAQEKVSGTVVDATGEPVIGASVLVKGTSNGTITDMNGNFTIRNVPRNGTLVISYVGYRTQNVPVAGNTNISVTMEDDKQLLEEVVVVGYGLQRKSDVTGALTRVGEKDCFVDKTRKFYQFSFHISPLMAENHFEQHGEWIKVCDRLRSEWSLVDIGEPIEAVADLLRHWPADWSISNDVGNNEFWVSRA